MKRLRSIDFLRGTVALFLVTDYAFQTIASFHGSFPWQHAAIGTWKIFAFVLLSGYANGYASRHKVWTPVSTFKYWLKRYLRLLVPYLLAASSAYILILQHDMPLHTFMTRLLFFDPLETFHFVNLLLQLTIIFPFLQIILVHATTRIPKLIYLFTCVLLAVGILPHISTPWHETASRLFGGYFFLPFSLGVFLGVNRIPLIPKLPAQSRLINICINGIAFIGMHAYFVYLFEPIVMYAFRNSAFHEGTFLFIISSTLLITVSISVFYSLIASSVARLFRRRNHVVSCLAVLSGVAMVTIFFLTRTTASPEKHGTAAVRILILSEWISDGPGAWPHKLEKLLTEAYKKPVIVIPHAVPGTTTDKVGMQLPSLVATYHPSIVITMIGINDLNDSPLLRDSYDLAQDRGVNTQLFGLIPIADMVSSINHYIERILIFKTISFHPNTVGVNELFAYVDSLRHTDIENQIFAYKTLISHYPNSSKAYIMLGNIYFGIDRHQAEMYYKKALTVQSDEDMAYVKLGALSPLQKELFPTREAYFQKALFINPKNILAYNYLAEIATETKDYQKAEYYEDIILSTDPNNSDALYALGTLYLDRLNKPALAKMYFEKYIRKNPSDPNGYWAMASVDRQLKDTGDLTTWEQKAIRTEEQIKPSTVKNYRQIKEYLITNGIRLVAVQYPLRDVLLLRQTLGNDLRVTYIDTNDAFQKAIGKNAYNDYFSDRIGGNFGHLNTEGNRLLADQIAGAMIADKTLAE